MSSRPQILLPRPGSGWRYVSLILAFLAGITELSAASSGEGLFGRQPPPSNRVLEAKLGEFSPDDYLRSVEKLISAYEAETGRELVPGERGRAGLKVYAASGAGLSTPQNLVRAVIKALERRGFSRNQLVIVGLNELHLRSGGFIPPLSIGGESFDGVPVIDLQSGRYYDSQWFYDSPLPSHSVSLGAADGGDIEDAPVAAFDRKSFLPTPLIFDVDFWINLPICSDHPVLGINGALVNATLWNASNTRRFFRSPVTGPAAVAEIAAIPEFHERLVFTIMSLERYQYIGGPIFNSLYTVSEPLLWLSENPVMIDALMRERMNRWRKRDGFKELPGDLRLLGFCEQLGLGAADTSLAEWKRID